MPEDPLLSGFDFFSFTTFCFLESSEYLLDEGGLAIGLGAGSVFLFSGRGYDFLDTVTTVFLSDVPEDDEVPDEEVCLFFVSDSR